MEGGAQEDGGDDRLEALEAAHLAAFSAFRREASAADSAVGDEPTAKDHLHPSLNVGLARRVFDGPQGTVDLVPGRGSICYVCIFAGSGETIIGHTSTALAARDPAGFVRSPGVAAATFAGVLPAGAHDPRIIDRSGRAIPVPLSDDSGYWMTVAEPIDMRWTADDGTQRRSLVTNPRAD